MDNPVKQPTPGTLEWQQWVAEQKSHPLRDGHDHEATPETASAARAQYEKAMREADDKPARTKRAKPRGGKRAGS
jgi:hypothetical protein